MNLVVNITVLFFGPLVLTSVRGDTQTSDVHILAKLEALTARVDVLESRDLQHRQHAVVMRTKLARQGRELLYLRHLVERHDKTPPKENIDEQNDVGETDDVKTTNMLNEGVSEKPDNKQAVPRIRRQEFDINVAFLAILVSDAHNLGHNQNIVFDHVVTNEGNAYNPHHGLFVAPKEGTYVFSTSVTTIARDRSHFGFAVNGQVITHMFVNGVDNNYDSSSQTVILKLRAGDDVFIKETDSDHTLNGDNHSMFSGFLLH